MAISAASPGAESLRARVGAHPLWYHTMDLAEGVVSPGWFDLRPIVDRLPWPEVTGKRCLDVGTFDGFLAFELERRGAREVLCTDISDEEHWDWPVDMRAQGPARLRELAGPDRANGFQIARAALGSGVQRVECSVYDLTPEQLGTFDVVVCGSLLLHLRDPLAALQAIRTVCGGVLMSAEEIRLDLTLLHPRRPIAQLNGAGELCQWWIANRSGHRRMLFAGGFEIERATRPYCVPFGPSHSRPRGLRSRLELGGRRLLTGHAGVPHAALLARPRL